MLLDQVEVPRPRLNWLAEVVRLNRTRHRFIGYLLGGGVYSTICYSKP
jgi:hypothetical protein